MVFCFSPAVVVPGEVVVPAGVVSKWLQAMNEVHWLAAKPNAIGTRERINSDHRTICLVVTYMDGSRL